MKYLFLVFIYLLGYQCAYTQNTKDNYISQAFGFYYENNQYEKAYSFYKKYVDDSVLPLINKFNLIVILTYNHDKKECEKILLVAAREGVELNKLIPYVEEKISLASMEKNFTFEKFYEEDWDRIKVFYQNGHLEFLKSLNLTLYDKAKEFIGIDQFVRTNNIGEDCLLKADTTNLNNFTNWLIGNVDSITKGEVASIRTIIRHLWPKHFEQLKTEKVFSQLLDAKILTATQINNAYEYINGLKGFYYPNLQTQIKHDWSLSGINTLAQIKEIDLRRKQVGLLPLEYCEICARQQLEVPKNLKYNKPLEELLDILIAESK